MTGADRHGCPGRRPRPIPGRVTGRTEGLRYGADGADGDRGASRGRPGPLARFAVLVPLVVLVACDAAPPPPAASAPAAAEFPWDAPWAQTTPDAPAAAGATPLPPAADAPLRWDLQVLGDIERPDGRVERSYRVTLHNGGQPLPGLLAVVTPAVAGVQVQQGLLVLGDTAPGATRTARRSLTLLHAADWAPQPSELAWALSADAALHGIAGALLPGAPDQPATAGLRDWQPPLLPGWRVEASLHPTARLAVVNLALQRHRLRIAQMRPGNHTLSLHPVGSASADGLQRAAQALPASGAFLHARVLAPPAVLDAAASDDAYSAATDPNSCQQ